MCMFNSQGTDNSYIPHLYYKNRLHRLCILKHYHIGTQDNFESLYIVNTIDWNSRCIQENIQHKLLFQNKCNPLVIIDLCYIAYFLKCNLTNITNINLVHSHNLNSTMLNKGSIHDCLEQDILKRDRNMWSIFELLMLDWL